MTLERFPKIIRYFDRDGRMTPQGWTQFEKMRRLVSAITVSATAPENPSVGDVWIDIS